MSKIITKNILIIINTLSVMLRLSKISDKTVIVAKKHIVRK